MVGLVFLVFLGFALILGQQRVNHRELLSLLSMESTIMSTETDLKSDLDAIKSGVLAVNTRLIGFVQQVADLSAQLAAGSPVSQGDLDALDAEAKDIRTLLDPMVPALAFPSTDAPTQGTAAGTPVSQGTAVASTVDAPFNGVLLTQKQIDNLTKADAAALTPDQLAALTPKQTAQVRSILAA